MLYNKVETGLFSQFWCLWRVYPFISQVARKYIIYNFEIQNATSSPGPCVGKIILVGML